MIYLYGYICYLKTVDRIWELSLFSCYLNYIIFSLFVSFKTYNLGKNQQIYLVVLKKLNS